MDISLDEYAKLKNKLTKFDKWDKVWQYTYTTE